jgi:hypothetical protein
MMIESTKVKWEMKVNVQRSRAITSGPALYTPRDRQIHRIFRGNLRRKELMTARQTSLDSNYVQSRRYFPVTHITEVILRHSMSRSWDPCYPSEFRRPPNISSLQGTSNHRSKCEHSHSMTPVIIVRAGQSGIPSFINTQGI